MTERTNALKGVNVTTRRRAGGPTQRIAPGTYPNTFFAAPLVDVAGPPENLDVTVAAFPLAAGQTVPVLLFVADTVIHGECWSEYAALQLENVAQDSVINFPAPVNFRENFRLVSNEATQAPAILTPRANIVGVPVFSPVVQKQQSEGVTDTNTVDVTGYLGAIDIATRTPPVESPIATPVDPSLTLTVHSEGVPIFGPTRQFDATQIAGDPTSAECIIMNETAYTQQMSDDGNIFVDGNAVVQWIVGIYGPQF